MGMADQISGQALGRTPLIGLLDSMPKLALQSNQALDLPLGVDGRGSDTLREEADPLIPVPSATEFKQFVLVAIAAALKPRRNHQ